MRSFLTGTEGQVGGALLPLLQRFGTVITPKLAEFDFTKPETLTASLDQARPDIIVNPAAYTAVDRAEHDVPMVHFSTDYVFDGSGDVPWREDSATGPLSVYGASKLAGDNAIKAAGGPHLIVRTSWVYAARGANFLQTMVRLAAERLELRVVVDQIGAPTTAKAISDALIAILEPGMSGNPHFDWRVSHQGKAASQFQAEPDAAARGVRCHHAIVAASARSRA